MLLTPSEVLRERYRVIGLLGQGGMAAVFCAHDRTLDRLVAVKQLRPDPFADERAIREARQQFRREAQILATLDHPNLPRVTDYFERDDIEYLVMDYVEGQTLSEVAEKTGSGLSERTVLEWSDQLLSALDYIHRHGIIHRDVKPSNIRLTPDGRIYLVDFGLVKLFDATNPKTATIMQGLGTPEYAPPEQYDAHLGHTDPRSDVYALGATMYHLLTGRAPATATQRVADPGSFKPPRALGANISPDVERIILRAMELPRARRFASAVEMRGALLHAQRVPPPEISLTRRLPQWAYSERGAAVRRIAVWAVLALIVLGGVSALASGPAPAATLTTDTATATSTPNVPPPTLTPTITPTPTRTRRATSISGLNSDATRTPEIDVPTVRQPMTSTTAPTPSRTSSPTLTVTSSRTAPPASTPTPSVTPSATESPTPSPTLPPTATFTPTERPSPSPTPEPSTTQAEEPTPP